jgi:hypothetical protein
MITSMLSLDIQGHVVLIVAKSLGRSSSSKFLCVAWISQSMKFTLTTCTSIIDPNLVWGDFTNFYVIIFFSEALQSHALFKYP